MKSADNSLTEAQKKAFDAYNRNDHKVALRLLTPLAKQGDIPAQLALVNIYRRGVWGCSIDLSRASYWLEQVTAKAENGCVEAQWALYEFYYWTSELQFGWHNAASDHWLAAAANSGLPEAQIELSMRYRLGGFGMKKNLKKADYWLDQAVAQQDPEALLDKAFTYFENGRPTDKAKVLLKAAVARGSVRATEYLDRD
jgi:TPR repeat protein